MKTNFLPTSYRTIASVVVTYIRILLSHCSHIRAHLPAAADYATGQVPLRYHLSNRPGAPRSGPL